MSNNNGHAPGLATREGLKPCGCDGSFTERLLRDAGVRADPAAILPDTRGPQGGRIRVTPMDWKKSSGVTGMLHTAFVALAALTLVACGLSGPDEPEVLRHTLWADRDHDPDSLVVRMDETVNHGRGWPRFGIVPDHWFIDNWGGRIHYCWDPPQPQQAYAVMDDSTAKRTGYPRGTLMAPSDFTRPCEEYFRRGFEIVATDNALPAIRLKKASDSYCPPGRVCMSELVTVIRLLAPIWHNLHWVDGAPDRFPGRYHFMMCSSLGQAWIATAGETWARPEASDTTWIRCVE